MSRYPEIACPRWCAWLLCAAAWAAGPLGAEEIDSNDLLRMKLEVLDLVVDSLVEEGVIPPERAEEIRLKAADRAQVEARDDEPTVAQAAAARAAVPANPQAAPDGEVARVDPATSENQLVIYVPEFIKDEIKADVREEVAADLVDEVLVGAQEAEWGIPGALPTWLKAIDWYGDLRLRAQVDVFSDRNQPNSIPDFQAINEAGGFVPAGDEAFRNLTENRETPSMRARLGFRANFREDISMGLRIATRGGDSPVFQEQVLGQATETFDVTLDRAYVQWVARDVYDFPWLRLQGGRFDNPYLHTDLVWDPDLAFQGVLIGLYHDLGGGLGIYDERASDSHIRLTAGAHPLVIRESPFDDSRSNDEWLIGLQLAFDHERRNRNRFQAAFSLYEFTNVVGDRNPVPGDTSLAFTGPEFLQQGNTLFSIQTNTAGDTTLFGLASDYTYLNFTTRADLYNFEPYRISVFGDFVWNIAYDEDEVFARTGVNVPARNVGYQVGAEIGSPTVQAFRDWAVYASYKLLQRDAVLDAYTDNDFHLGGTDAQGFILGARYGLSDYAWMEARWLQADEIDGPPFGVQVFQFDLNSRF